MTCHSCGATMEPTQTGLPFKVTESAIVIVKQVPVMQCSSCREYLIEDVVMKRVEEILASVDSLAELEVVSFAA
ncbi:MAG: YgiT-type zinc finger protein [Candidatus Hydrogenedentes bacterium]|nr:YgiT-type zinc finger protein [Candidatus Hydrogenedentota bacterium]